MDETSAPLPEQDENVITFKRSHFYSAMVVLAFAAGLLVGYLAWGRAAATSQTVAAQPSSGNPVVQAPVATSTPRIIRYDIPDEGFPSLGPEDAPIVIVEFSDFQCPFCARFHQETYEALLAAYPGQIRFVYRHLPLTSIHPQAFPAAEASMCASDQNAFWQYHDALFDNQASLGQELYLQIATDLGFDMAAFEECLTSGKYTEFVQSDMDFALGLGVRSTPTFFINGLAVVGAQPLEVFTQVIDKELAGEFPE